MAPHPRTFRSFCPNQCCCRCRFATHFYIGGFIMERGSSRKWDSPLKERQCFSSGAAWDPLRVHLYPSPSTPDSPPCVVFPTLIFLSILSHGLLAPGLSLSALLPSCCRMPEPPRPSWLDPTASFSLLMVSPGAISLNRCLFCLSLKYFCFDGDVVVGMVFESLYVAGEASDSIELRY